MPAQDYENSMLFPHTSTTVQTGYYGHCMEFKLVSVSFKIRIGCGLWNWKIQGLRHFKYLPTHHLQV